MTTLAVVLLAAAVISLPWVAFRAGYKIGAAVVSEVLTDAARRAGADPARFLAAVEQNMAEPKKFAPAAARTLMGTSDETTIRPDPRRP
jgi:hypothetical protein